MHAQKITTQWREKLKYLQSVHAWNKTFEASGLEKVIHGSTKYEPSIFNN